MPRRCCECCHRPMERGERRRRCGECDKLYCRDCEGDGGCTECYQSIYWIISAQSQHHAP